MAVFISGESVLGWKVFPAPTPILAKRAISSVSEGTVGQNCKYEVQFVEKLERLSLFVRRQGLEEINRRRGGWGGLTEKRRERLHLVARGILTIWFQGPLYSGFLVSTK
jgi:hypothetical protein